jgi:shikimate kinase
VRTVPTPQHVVLVGMMGAGKTTTAVALAERLGWPMRDCDLDLEERAGASGAELADSDGLARLHDLEEEVLLDALADEPPLVVTAAGSVVSSARVRERLADHRATVVWLDVPVDELVARMATSTHRRRLDRPGVQDLLARREAHLVGLADLRLDARVPTSVLVDRIVDALTAGPPPPG